MKFQEKGLLAQARASTIVRFIIHPKELNLTKKKKEI